MDKISSRIYPGAELAKDTDHRLFLALASEGIETAMNYLRQHNAPEELVQLIDDCILLERAGVEMQFTGTVDDSTADFAASGVFEVPKLIVALGGKFFEWTNNTPPVPWEAGRQAANAES